jgi:mono/diheme cytochrome c family protein
LNFYYGTKGDPKYVAHGELVAWDPLTQTARWRCRHKNVVNGGTLATAGNLVFQGTPEGTLEAYTADTGKLVWSFDAHGWIQSAPTTVEVDGQQVILVASGNSGSASLGNIATRFISTAQSRSPSRLLAFTLGGTGTVPPTIVKQIPKPPMPRQDPQLVNRGGYFFDKETCVMCHGYAAENAGGVVADLRMASAETHAKLSEIVVARARRAMGMPSFPNLLPDELKAIDAFIINQAWTGY